MSRPHVLAPGVVLPQAGYSWRAVRSSGPGGQNVNKVASKVELRVTLDAISGLPADARARLAAAARNRLDAVGRLLIVSQRTRDQARNLEDAVERLRDLVRRALVRPKARRASAPSGAARERRLESKRRTAERKRSRGRVEPD